MFQSKDLTSPDVQKQLDEAEAQADKNQSKPVAAGNVPVGKLQLARVLSTPPTAKSKSKAKDDDDKDSKSKKAK